MNATTVSIVLGIYAILLAAGGVMGFVKAPSRPSLIAGLVSAGLAVIAAVLANSAQSFSIGRGLGIVLSLGLALFFGRRYLATRKVMPAAVMTGVSALVLILLLFSF